MLQQQRYCDRHVNTQSFQRLIWKDRNNTRNNTALVSNTVASNRANNATIICRQQDRIKKW